MKKLLYVTLFVTLFISIFILTASAATKYGDLYYTVSNGEVTITDCSMSVTSVTIPEKINGYPVTSIGSYAFSNCTSLTSITIPDSVTSINSYAFCNCTGLKEVHITDIESWLNIKFGDSYDANPLCYAVNGLYIDGKPITTVTIPDSVTSIGSLAFRNCTSLTSVTIGNSVTSIGYRAFSNCTGLKEVHITDIESWLNIKFGDGYDDANPLCYADNGLYIDGKPITTVTIPDSVTSIGSRAFYNCDSLISITIPNSVTSIGERAFNSCDSLTSITIPDSVTSIGSGAFYNCESLVKVKISKESELASIGESAFYNCSSLSQMTFSPKIQSVGYNAFENCISVQRVDIYDIASWCTLENKGYNFFPYDNAINLYYNGELLEELVIPDGVTKIREYAFFNCRSIRTVKIPTSVTCIGDEAFGGCYNINGLYIDDIIAWCNVDIINGDNEEYAYRWHEGNTALTTADLYLKDEIVKYLIIPDGVTTIKKGSFYGCNSIKTIEIPKSVQSIQAYAFANCYPQKVTVSSSTAFIASTAFDYSETKFHGFIGTYTEEFAELKGYTFVPLDDVIYEITYNLSGGEGKFETGKKGVYADYYITSTIPTKLHCTFLGWATEEKGEVVYKSGDVYTANSSLNLYAVWQEPQTIINDITVTPGGNFYVDVVVENCVPVKAITINDIEYSETLTLTSAEWLLTDSILSSVDTNGDSVIAFESAIDANKAVMRLYFTADSELEDQDAYIRYKAKGTDEENVVFDFVVYDGTVKIRNFIVGDCDGDETVTIDDAIYLAFYTFYAERYPLPNGMDVDFNNDGSVTIDDAIYLAFYTFYQDRYPLN